MDGNTAAKHEITLYGIKKTAAFNLAEHCACVFVRACVRVFVCVYVCVHVGVHLTCLRNTIHLLSTLTPYSHLDESVQP